MSAIVSANEAAHHWGVSEKTVRRWIKAGRLKADKSGRAYRVVLSEVAALIGPDTAHDSGPSADTVQTADTSSAPSTTDSRSAMSGIAELVGLVDRLTVENRQLAETAAVWQERARVLEERLALAAPADSPTAPILTPEPGTPPSEPRGARSWWSVRWLVVLAISMLAIGTGAAWLLRLFF